jgi:hypothetical protein
LVASHIPQVAPIAAHALTESAVQVVPPAQQPVGQEVASHTQPEPEQRWPMGHAIAAPQRQSPAAPQLSARASQATQVEPALPQVLSPRAWQTLAAQHPLGHEVASHTQLPPTQRWPPAHCGLLPQAHLPSAPQPSERAGSQATHSAPPTPQVASARALQVVPAQQPAAHETASQTHMPPTQRCPATHCVAPPQRQSPVTAHESARFTSQLVHAPPLTPQEPSARG